MCLGIPMQIVEIDGFNARCAAKGVSRSVSLFLMQHEELGVGDYVMVHTGYAPLPFFSLALGLIGAAAVATISSLMAMHDVFRPLRYCGRNSIVIYLAFFLPMATTRTLLIKTGWVTDIGTMSVIVTAVGVIGSLALFWAVRGNWAKFLFERPAQFWLVPKPAPKPKLTLQPAE